MQAVDHIHEHHREHEHEHPTRNVQAWVKTALLLALGGYFVYVIASGSLTNYINERFAWLSYVAAALFLLLGISSAFDLRRGSHDHEHNHDGHEHHHHDDHNHSHAVSWPVLAVVAIPLVLGTLIPSRPLGSAAVDGNISLSAVSAANATTFTTDPLTWNVLDWLRSFNNSDDINSFNGKQADVTGFLYREGSFADDTFMLARFTVSCCVADASAIGVPVQWDSAKEFPADTWLHITGLWQVGEFRGDTVPILQAVDVEQIDQPEHPYLYP